MAVSPNRRMTKSALALAKTAFEVAKKAIPPYSHPNTSYAAFDAWTTCGRVS